MVRWSRGLLLLLSVLAIVATMADTIYLPRVSQPLASKRGVALATGGCEVAAAVGANWQYVWGPDAPVCPSVEGVPMAWGSVPDSVSSDTWLLGFNEPDLPYPQSDLAPDRAAQLWRELEQGFPDRKLVAPAPSDQHPEWIEQFRFAYLEQYGEAPRLDALAVHCYLNSADACIELVDQYEDWARVWGVPELWVTEWATFSCNGWGMGYAIFEMQAFQVWMEGDPLVTRYAWFSSKPTNDAWSFPPDCNTQLVDDEGELTDFGKTYLGD